MNQILLGAALPFAIGVLIYAVRRFRAGFRTLLLVPLFMAAGSMWAIAPDLPRLFGFNELYGRLSRDPRCDIFLWHYTIDKLESDAQWYGVVLLLMAGSLLFAAWRELYIAERDG